MKSVLPSPNRDGVFTAAHMEIAQRDASSLLAALDADYQMIGLRYERNQSGMVVELERGGESGSTRVGGVE